MRRALALARLSQGHTRPNPPVGAVVVRGGKIVGEGRHVRCGADHAEAAALKKAGASAKGATVYVTLEPCSKKGRVGACCDALIAAGVKKAVWACTDPNPRNAGRAMRILRAAGIETECWQKSREPGKRALAAEALGLIAPFAKHVTTGMPYVTVKIAMSLDGRICDGSGNAQWVSSEPARRLTGTIRQRVDAVMVGAQTLRNDNPSLLSRGRRNDSLHRIVVTRSGELPADAQVFTDSARDRTLVLRVGGGGKAPVPPAEVVDVADLREAMAVLAARGFMHILCEGGFGLARSLASAGLVDEWITVLAPKVIGSGSISAAAEIGRTLCVCDFPELRFPSSALPGAVRHVRHGSRR
jgi:diaminohydroxyphosphoribosylaminopyrimidine deaminase/5-amino-6-(5-phosphoribosylamino)uracil reductase